MRHAPRLCSQAPHAGRRRILALASLAVAGVLAGATSAAGTAPQPAFPQQARIVWIDVSVLDSGEAPLSELGGEDFEVLEGGRARPIVSFHAAPSARVAVVLAEDLLAKEPDLARMREGVRRLAAGFRDDDRLLLAAASGVSLQAVLPADASRLDKELARLRADPAGLAGLAGLREADVAALHARRVTAAESALAALEGLAGSRALVLLGPALPYDTASGFGASAYERLMRASQRAGAPVYFLGCDSALSEPGPLPGLLEGGSGGVARVAPLFPARRAAAVAPEPRVYDAVAAGSGGFSALGSANWADAVDRIVSRARARYVLGIAAPPESWDGRFHPVDVRVGGRKGARVHARAGYFAEGAAGRTP